MACITTSQNWIVTVFVIALQYVTSSCGWLGYYLLLTFLFLSSDVALFLISLHTYAKTGKFILAEEIINFGDECLGWQLVVMNGYLRIKFYSAVFNFIIYIYLYFERTTMS